MRKRKFNNDGIIFLTELNIECEDDLGEDPKREYSQYMKMGFSCKIIKKSVFYNFNVSRMKM